MICRALKTLDFSDDQKRQKCKSSLTNCIYLEDSGVEIYGIKIYGSPW